MSSQDGMCPKNILLYLDAGPESVTSGLGQVHAPVAVLLSRAEGATSRVHTVQTR